MRQLFLLCLSILFSKPGYAQFKNIKLDEQLDGNTFMYEPSIAISPKDSKNIVAVSSPDNVYVSKDGGANWQKNKIKSGLGVAGNPSIIAGSKGTFYFFHLSDPTQGTGGSETEKLDRIVIQQSDDGGLTWSEGESIGLNHPKDQKKQWPAIDSKGNLYLTWTQFDKYGNQDPNCLSHILFSKSKNGKKWSVPVQISQTPGNCVDDDLTTQGAVPAASADGKLFIIWSNQEKIFFDRSYDDGERWLTNDLVIAQQPGGWNLKIPGHQRTAGMPVLMVNNSRTTARGHIYVVWADQKNGADDTDVWFLRSSNNGDYWTQPLKVNNDEKGKHQYLPWIAVDQTSGYIYMIYYDRRAYDDNQTDVYLAYSKDSGNSFVNVKISESPFTPDEGHAFGDYTNIAAQNGIITPVWTRMDNGKTSIWTSIITHEELEKLAKSNAKTK